jgi:uncharacterized phage protein gp47/JayE
MALNAPTIKEIADNIIGDIESKLGQVVPLLAKAVFRVMSYAFGGVWLLLYKQGVWFYNQTFPQLAGETFLELLGENKRVIRTPAIAWVGDIEVIVLASGTLFAGTQLVNTQTGVIYVLTDTTAVTVGTEVVEIKATTPGEIGSLQVAQEIDFVSPLGFVEDTVEVDAETTPGSDQEDLEDYRARVIDAYQKQPQGGALADYEQWAEETPDVINAYPYPGTLPSEVDVYIEVDNQTDGIPTAPQLAAALQYITYDPITGRQDRKPVTADVTTLAITRTAFDVEITGLSPDTSEIRSAIQTALENYFIGREPYILGLSIERLDKITISSVTSIADNAAAANGATFTTLDLEQGGSPVTTYTLGDGEKAKLGTLTWTA